MDFGAEGLSMQPELNWAIISIHLGSVVSWSNHVQFRNPCSSSFPKSASRVHAPPFYHFTPYSMYIHTHTSPTVANHAIRSAFFALILLKKMPSSLSATVDPETLVLAALLHDLGWSKDPGLLSEDKRFEVGGANAARDFARTHMQLDDICEDVKEWDEEHLQRLWYALALHTTPSIAMHAEPVTIMTGMAIQAGFMGPNLPSQVPGVEQQSITPDEFTEIIRAYPRLGFKK